MTLPDLRLAALALAAALSLSPGATAFAQNTEAAFRTSTLNLSATGEVRAPPDIVTLALGATSEASSAQAATTQTTQRINAVVAALRRQGIAPRDIQTQYVNLTPRYSDNSNAPREIIPQRATTALMVTVRDIDRAGALMDIAIAAGANQVQGVRFGLSDPAAAKRQARDTALRALQDNAAQVADVMGHRVVRLVTVSAQAYSEIVMTANRVQEPSAPGSRFEPGEIVINANANGVFEIAPK